jgi:phosphoribosylformimino-5-aminoimidazole carboxamide ribotide isomerase
MESNKINIIQLRPAIDLMGGKCVRLVGGKFDQVTDYGSDPLEFAKRFEDWGLEYLHLVDLDAAKTGLLSQYRWVERIVSKTAMKVDVGGGIQSEDAIRIAFESGASQVNVGTAAVKNPDLVYKWLKTFGPERIMISMDMQVDQIRIRGWVDDAEIEWKDFLQNFVKMGSKYFVCTDTSKDGMLAGPSFEMYNNIRKAAPDIFIMASGGVASMDDVLQLQESGVQGVIIGKALYEGNITEEDIKSFTFLQK